MSLDGFELESINLQIFSSQFFVSLHKGSDNVPIGRHCVFGPLGSYLFYAVTPIYDDGQVLQDKDFD